MGVRGSGHLAGGQPLPQVSHRHPSGAVIPDQLQIGRKGVGDSAQHAAQRPELLDEELGQLQAGLERQRGIGMGNVGQEGLRWSG